MTLDEFCERVWTGRNQLRALGVDAGMKDVRVMVSRESYYYLRLELATRLRSGVRVEPCVVIPATETESSRMVVFGLLVKSSRDLDHDNGAIRFRSELSV